MKLIVGLGNPGKEYEEHRHNVGWMALDKVLGGVAYEEKFNAFLVRRDGHIFFKPQTYMNSSGDAVYACAAFFKIEPKDIIVVHDEMDIPMGDVRIKTGGGHAGHNGIKSVINRMNTKEFVRVRLGIGRPDEGVEVLQHVLGNFKKEDDETLSKMLAQASTDILKLLSEAFSKED